MPNAEHLQDAADALADIQEDGQSATLYVTSNDDTPAWAPTYDPDSGITIYVLRTESEKKMAEGDSIRQMSREKFMVGQPTTPLVLSVGDEVEVESVRYTILEVSRFAPADTTIFWDIVVGRG